MTAFYPLHLPFLFILSIFTNNHYNSEYKHFNTQEQIITSMMLEGHSREGTNASPVVYYSTVAVALAD